MLEKLGKTIKEQREFLNLSQEELGIMCNVHPNTIARTEKGENISVSTMLSICDGLDLTPADLWDFVEEQK